MGILGVRRRILITGASRGIGRATALELARAGHQVVVAARDEARLAQLASEIADARGACEVAPVDVTDDESVRACVARVLARGPVDVLLNNAGSLDQELFLAQPEATRRSEMELNYFGALRVTRAVLPSLIQAGSGLIVNVSSILGTVGTATTANYGASKAALEAFSHALRGELSPHGVRVTVFVAPHTETDLGAGAEFRGLRSMRAEYVARELVRAVDRAPRRYAAGGYLRMGLRLAAWFPAFMEAQLAAMVKHLIAAGRRETN